MRKNKYQIFISSTYLDLKDERDSLIRATLEIGHIPVGMEMFSAGDESQWNIIKKTIDDCDYYVVIVGHRYGSTLEGISYTEMEYDYAVSKKIPTLGFIIDPKSPRPHDLENRDGESELVERLSLFKSKVSSKIVSYWKDKNDLSRAYLSSLFKAETLCPRSGWVRSIENDREQLLDRIKDLSAQNEVLSKKITEQTSNTENAIRQAIKKLSSQKVDIYFVAEYSERQETLTKKNVRLLEIFISLAKSLLYTHREYNISDGRELSMLMGFEEEITKYDNDKTFILRIAFDSIHAIEKIRDTFEAYNVLEYVNKGYGFISHDLGTWKLTTFGKKVYKHILRESLA